MKAKSLDALKLEYTELIDRYHDIEALLPEVKQCSVDSRAASYRFVDHRHADHEVHPLPVETQEFYEMPL